MPAGDILTSFMTLGEIYTTPHFEREITVPDRIKTEVGIEDLCDLRFFRLLTLQDRFLKNLLLR